jgi:hypothetical protein
MERQIGIVGRRLCWTITAGAKLGCTRKAQACHSRRPHTSRTSRQRVRICDFRLSINYGAFMPGVRSTALLKGNRRGIQRTDIHAVEEGEMPRPFATVAQRCLSKSSSLLLDSRFAISKSTSCTLCASCSLHHARRHHDHLRRGVSLCLVG